MEALDGLPKEKIHCSVLAERGYSVCNQRLQKQKGMKHRLKIIVTSVTRNVTIQTNNPIKYNIKTDKTLLFCHGFTVYNHEKNDDLRIQYGVGSRC